MHYARENDMENEIATRGVMNSVRGGLFSYLPSSTAMRHPEALARYWDELLPNARTYTSISGETTQFPYAGGPIET